MASKTSRIERYRQALADVLFEERGTNWRDTRNEEIYLQTEEDVKKLLDDLAKAAMKLADEERGAERGDSGSTKL